MTSAPTGSIPKGQIQHMALKDFQEFGYLAEVNRQFLHPLGLALAIDVHDGTAAIWDAREDPEGWVYSAVDFQHLAAKAARVSAEWDARGPVRLERLGYVVQPIDPNVGIVHPSQLALEEASAAGEEASRSRFASEAPPPYTPQGFTDGEGYVEERNHDNP